MGATNWIQLVLVTGVVTGVVTGLITDDVTGLVTDYVTGLVTSLVKDFNLDLTFQCTQR